MVTHSDLSPSSAHRWMACPGSVRISRGIQDAPSIYAEEGMAAHCLAEKSLREGKNPAAYIGTVIGPEDGTLFEVTEEMAKAVSSFTDEVCRLQSLPISGCLTEHRVDLSWISDGMFGTCDAVVWEAFDTLTVIDYKHGRGVVVEIDYNPQLLLYAAGAIRFSAACFDKVRFGIVQPRAYHPTGAVRMSSPMDPDDIITWAMEVARPAAELTRKPDAPVIPGAHCRFCPAIGICEKAYENATLAFRTVDIEANANANCLPDVDKLTPGRIAEILDKLPIMKAWLKEFEDAAYIRQKEEGDIPGYAIVPGRKSRRWAKEDAEIVTALAEIAPGIEATETKLRSVAQIAKEAKKQGADIQSLITIKQGLKLAPSTEGAAFTAKEIEA